MNVEEAKARLESIANDLRLNHDFPDDHPIRKEILEIRSFLEEMFQAGDQVARNYPKRFNGEDHAFVEYWKHVVIKPG